MLSKRLFHIASFINERDYAADIGADHGKLVLFLANKYKNSTFLAVENKKGPFNTLVSAVSAESINNNIECSLSDGIEYLRDDTNTLIFAGMGGINVVNIIEKSLKNMKNINKVVVCVNNKIVECLNYISKLGFYISGSDAIEEDDIIYMIFELTRYENKNENSENIFIYTYTIEKIKESLKNNDLFDKYIEKLVKNMALEAESKKNYEYYEFSDNFNLYYLLTRR